MLFFREARTTRPSIRPRYAQLGLILLSATVLLSGTRAFAAGTSGGAAPGELFRQLSAKVALSSGDYVTKALGTHYSFFVEVPPGLARLEIDLFDPDIGAAWDTGTASLFQITVLDPFGAPVLLNGAGAAGPVTAVQLCATGPCNNQWIQLFGQNAPAPGHWEIRTDSTGGTKRYLNGFGLRAHDSDPTAGGTELPVYAHSFVMWGNTVGSPQPNLTVYPHVTNGCTVRDRTYDQDNLGNNVISSRTGAFSATNPPSGNQAWGDVAMTGFTSASVAVDYGSWTAVLDSPNGVKDNWSVFYLGEDLAGPAAPTGQPYANSSRLYLPIDGGGVPVRPFLEQRLAATGAGPNPPVIGVASDFVVTVRVVNPTSLPISFSATNLVTANVPGGQVLYSAIQSVSQGTVVAQPAAGGAGNVQWNPGTVAAGSAALLSYRVTVTPTAATPVDVTPAPGTSNGTRATWVDGTCTGALCGAAQLGPATLSTGELCQLTIQTATLTHAPVTSFDVYNEDGIEVRWRTASEVGTQSWELWRRDAGEWVAVTEEPQPAVPEASSGATYSLRDNRAPSGETLEYALVERTQDGLARWWGPFVRSVIEYRPPEGALRAARAFRTDAREFVLDGYRATPILPDPLQRITTPALQPEALTADYLRALVPEDGLFEITVSQLGEVFGMTPEVASTQIAAGRFDLVRAGVSVPWIEDPEGSSIRFYGEGRDSIYGQYATYFLYPRPGTQISARRAAFAQRGSGGVSYTQVTTVEENNFAATAALRDPVRDIFFWQALHAGSPTLDVSVEASAIASGAVHLRVALFGAGATTHSAEVYLNGSPDPLGLATRDGSGDLVFEHELEPGELQEGVNLVSISRTAGVLYADHITLTYPRYAEAMGGMLIFEAEETATTTVGSLLSDRVVALDISEPYAPVAIAVTPQSDAGVWSLDLETTAERRYLVHSGAPQTLMVTAGFDGILPTSADWVAVVGARDLLPGAEELAARRSDEGLAAEVVLLEDVLDQRSAGDFDPSALSGFLSELGPSYVVLVGAGTFDYHDHLAAGGNLVPALLTVTEVGLFASDALYVDWSRSETDGLADTAIGRLPVVTAVELDGYLAKLDAYEADLAAGEEWTERHLMLADDAEAGANFGPDGRSALAPLAYAFDIEDVVLSPGGTVTTRRSLFEALDRGAGWVSYFGHGALTALAAEQLLTTDDLPSPTDNPDLDPFADQPFILGAMTCTAARYGLPGSPALAEELLLQAGGGAVAALSSSGLADDAASVELALQLASLLAMETPNQRLGDLILASFDRFVARGGRLASVPSYNLLGDPAQHVPSAEADQAGESDGVDGLDAPDDELFSDGFEIGSTAAWSLTV